MARSGGQTMQGLRRENAALKRKVTRLQNQLQKLRAIIASLNEKIARLTRHSGNSSKPPSSDLFAGQSKADDKEQQSSSNQNTPKAKGGKKTKGSKRKIGGQPGHPRHQRPPFPEKQIDYVHDYYCSGCPRCGSKDLQHDPTDSPRILQQAELPEKPLQYHQHQAHQSFCRDCQSSFYADFPAEVKAAGLCGPRLTAAFSFMKGQLPVSYTGIQQFSFEVLGFPISRGQLTNLSNKTSSATAVPYQKVITQLPWERILNIDETSHKENGRLMWTWCFRAQDFALYHISDTRGSAVLLNLLGKEFDGFIGCDYFSSYRKYMGEINGQLQFCLAHLIRDLKFLCAHPDWLVRKYGQELLRQVKRLFTAIHNAQAAGREPRPERLKAISKEIINTATCPPNRVHRLIGNMAKRFRDHGKDFFTFLTTPGLEPTNNLAERALRFVVIQRRMTQGTRSIAGRLFCERIWTVVSTCAIQKRSVFGYLYQALQAYFRGEPAPSILTFDTS